MFVARSQIVAAIFQCIFILFLQIDVSLCGENEKRLHDKILQRYNTLVRPVIEEASPVDVSLGITLQQIVDIDEKNQIIELNVWLTYKWHDYQLMWNATEFGGIDDIRLPPKMVWVPDVLLYNSVDESFDSTYPSNVIVRNNGDMEWIPPGIIKSSCKIDITFFPFDDQMCELKFGSWTYSGFKLNLTIGDVTLSTYTPNGEWKLMDVIPHRHEFKYDCCPEPYIDITYTIWVRRRTLYYGFNLIIPCLLISFLTLLDFMLPPDSGEKLALGITIFMSLIVFLLMVAEAMPPTSEAVPLVGIYFSAIMIIVSASVVFTVMVLNFHHRTPETHTMHPIVRKIFLNWLPWLLMMSRPGYIVRRGKLDPQIDEYSLDSSVNDSNYVPGKKISRKESHSPMFSKPLLLNADLGRESMVHFAPLPLKTDRKESLHPNRYQSSTNAALPTQLEPLLQEILRELKSLTKRQEDDDERTATINDWKFAAMVVDRLSLIIFTTVLVVSTVVILLFSPPYISTTNE